RVGCERRRPRLIDPLEPRVRAFCVERLVAQQPTKALGAGASSSAIGTIDFETLLLPSDLFLSSSPPAARKQASRSRGSASQGRQGEAVERGRECGPIPIAAARKQDRDDRNSSNKKKNGGGSSSTGSLIFGPGAGPFDFTARGSGEGPAEGRLNTVAPLAERGDPKASSLQRLGSTDPVAVGLAHPAQSSEVRLRLTRHGKCRERHPSSEASVKRNTGQAVRAAPCARGEGDGRNQSSELRARIPAIIPTPTPGQI
ncbi:hypothetical protein THAOC_18469, partial [Thalassiosira oceanica]